MTIPKEYTEMVGQKKILSGGIFSRQRAEPSAEYDILDIRQSASTICTFKSKANGAMKIDKEHPAFELLIKNSTMPRARWTNPFPIREINLRGKKGGKK